MSTTQTYHAIFEGGGFQLLSPLDLDLAEGQAVRLTVKPISSPEDILALATRVYEGFSANELQELEDMILERSTFFKEREAA